MDGDNTTTDQKDMSVCMEIAAAESILELNIEAPKAKDMK